ncbi:MULTISPECIES: hypothetical protein [Bradyrhizobium]|uniref:hypothetical protein n=1 Tax=Bradyrhizobium TaxID=374 RepID=UPI001CD7FAEF|nr:MULTISPECIES: hypothetical protein [unclassified Bradyrhizobium]MCA1497865.1 hypothetical protein [Bradyrhizobium sp. NBAIM14]MCA1515074.1 hypothetical protein [Bradyrhizobium sp. NBAIM01]MCA1537092.1 hypothetical protein [Bradyrhizobium sp. NBAIM03]MCA1544659.1 hypothetical protein [Bradyrhizobium sp. NBAIM32]UWU81890.1 hypothetical protein N2605_19915 [Bradyrhizobium sp. CB1024]
MAISLAERTAQLDAEQRLLVKAEQDIESGWQRVRNQEDRVRELMAGGHDTCQAERLVDLLKQTLVEWERHRTLIEQRVAFLQREVNPEA